MRRKYTRSGSQRVIPDKTGWELVHHKKGKRYAADKVGDFIYQGMRFIIFFERSTRKS